MSNVSSDAGYRQPLKNRNRKALASAAIAAMLATAMWFGSALPLSAAGESRSISLYHVHTKENLTVTYMQNGRYVPSAMKKINYLMRDWRRNSTVTIDPKTLDLMWELHADLRSSRPIHIVCGYRSGKTNAFLKRSGRNVARHSQHVKGKAIDFYFPDVPTVKIRNSALVRKVGGVGYYRSSGGPTGFLHVDSGNVRHWGPAISNSQWASIMRESGKSRGARPKSSGSFAMAQADETPAKSGSILGWFTKGRKNQVDIIRPGDEPQLALAEQAPNYAGYDEDLADLAADAAAAPTKRRQGKKAVIEIVPDDGAEGLPTGEMEALSQTAAVETAADAAPADVKRGYPVPRPRLKPIEIMMVAAANMKLKIEPASAPPETSLRPKLRKPVMQAVASEAAAEKTDFAAELRNGTAEDAPLMRPVMAVALASDTDWWPSISANGEAILRQNGMPPDLDAQEDSPLPRSTSLVGTDAAVAVDASAEQHSAEGKGDMLTVNREGKGSLPPIPHRVSYNTQ
jgi:uncharacterized protein YcbK (DUF882 family)